MGSRPLPAPSRGPRVGPGAPWCPESAGPGEAGPLRAMKQRAVGTTRQSGTQVLPRRHEPDAEVGVMLSPQNPELPGTALRAR